MDSISQRSRPNHDSSSLKSLSESCHICRNSNHWWH